VQWPVRPCSGPTQRGASGGGHWVWGWLGVCLSVLPRSPQVTYAHIPARSLVLPFARTRATCCAPLDYTIELCISTRRMQSTGRVCGVLLFPSLLTHWRISSKGVTSCVHKECRATNCILTSKKSKHFRAFKGRFYTTFGKMMYNERFCAVSKACDSIALLSFGVYWQSHRSSTGASRRWARATLSARRRLRRSAASWRLRRAVTVRRLRTFGARCRYGVARRRWRSIWVAAHVEIVVLPHVACE
jgi:hypothetical protein